MAIVIKEIRVNTVVEKKVVETSDIFEHLYRRIKEEIVRELSLSSQTIVLVSFNRKIIFWRIMLFGIPPDLLYH